MTKTDPVTLELLNNALSAVMDEMMITTRRTGYSGSIKYLMDFSAALCDRDGRMIAQGVAMPHHLGAMPGAIDAVRAKFGDTLEPGDIVITNDPWEGSTHLPDIYLVKPIFWADELVAYACHCSHHIDVGGRVPGSMAADSRSIHEEGIRIPPLKLYARGVENEAIMAILRKNVRLPQMLMGDLRAQIVACGIGEREVRAMFDKYGREMIDLYWNELIDYGERLCRAAIQGIADGTYSFTDYVDDDGVTGKPLKIQVELTVSGSDLNIDFAGSSAQTPGAINAVMAWTLSAVYTVLRSVLPRYAPNNDGAFRPVTVVAPEGSFVNAKYPAACAARGVTGHRLDDALFGAFAVALPEKIPAASEGGNCSSRISGTQPDGKQFILQEVVCGSRGGRPNKDGVEGLVNPGQNLSNQPVEVVEAEFPVRINRYGFVPDSGGAGRYRGGLALMREWELLVDNVVFQQRSDRFEHAPWGVLGGQDGTLSKNVKNSGSATQERLPAKFVLNMNKHDRVLYVTPGSGGYGDPFLRDPEAVAHDVRNEKISVEYARREYGVVVDVATLELNTEATAALRSAHE